MLFIQFAARNAVLQRSMKSPTVEHLVEANSIVRAIRVQQHHKLSFHPADPEQLHAQDSVIGKEQAQREPVSNKLNFCNPSLIVSGQL